MPEIIVKELWLLVPTVIYAALALLLFGISVWLMEKVTPFSIHKEIVEDENIALGVIIAGALIGLAILLGAVISG